MHLKNLLGYLAFGASFTTGLISFSQAAQSSAAFLSSDKSPPSVQSLIVPEGGTEELNSGELYEYGDVIIKKGGTLTVKPWKPEKKKGGSLKIICKNLYIEERGAIKLDGCGHTGGTKKHLNGYGPGGGQGGDCCAGGGSNGTKGGDGAGAGVHPAKAGKTYPISYDTKKPPLGSGGGAISYSEKNKIPEVDPGAAGGGALYLQAENIYLFKGAEISAAGVGAGPLTGAAGSGGSLYIVAKNIHITEGEKREPFFSAQGGSNEEADYPHVVGQGGHGQILIRNNNLYKWFQSGYWKFLRFFSLDSPLELSLTKDEAISTNSQVLRFWIEDNLPEKKNATSIISIILPFTLAAAVKIEKDKLCRLYQLMRADCFEGKAQEEQSKKIIQSYLNKALEIRKKSCPSEQQPDIAALYDKLALAAFETREKIKYYLKALEIREKLYGSCLKVAESYERLGNAYAENEQINKTIECFKKAEHFYCSSEFWEKNPNKERVTQRLIYLREKKKK